MSQENSTANDYALAKILNERVSSIFAFVADHRSADLPDLTDINRSYVLLVNELQTLYARHEKLSSIGENICWRTFKSIDAIDPYTLYEYSDDYKNHSIEHISLVNNLCIINRKETPDISPELQELLDEASENISSLVANWLIPEYTFEITEGGTLLVNGVAGVMNIKKAHASSPLEVILRYAKERPDEIFKPTDLKLDSNQLQRGVRTYLTEAGFTGAIEKLFFPVMDEKRGFKFRPVINRRIANKERINLTELDRKLKNLGVETVYDTYKLPL